MLSQLRRGHQHEFDGGLMSARTLNNHGEQWKSSERVKSSPLNNNLLPDVYPTATRSTSSVLSPDLSRAFRVDAYLLAIIRIEDKRNPVYSTEVVTKLRQKEQTQSFINKPCSLFITERSFIIFDRGTQSIAETVPLENVDPTCVYAETTDTLNDIFMYRSIERHHTSSAVTTNQANHSNTHESTSVIVFKCSNKESRLLVETIRGIVGKPMKTARSVRSDPRSTLDRTGGMSFYDPQSFPHDHPPMMHPTYAVAPQPSARSMHQQHSTMLSPDHYRHLTEDLNKCFDDIELFVRYLESLVEYTKELDRDHRRKDRKSSSGLKKMVEELPEDRFFIDILQKFKHSFNLLGELKHIIHNPNAPELIHYLLSPLQFIVSTLRSKHVHQLQLAQDIWAPTLTKESRDLLLNCLTSKEHEILRNLGPAWLSTAEETPQKFHDYRPVFFEGRPLWFQEPSTDRPIQTARSTDERQPPAWPTTRSYNQNNNNNGVAINPNVVTPRQPSPMAHFDSSTVDRSGKNGHLDTFNAQMQNEHAWAIERKQAGAKICAVKVERKGQNNKELTVRRGELIEIENSSKKWWRAKNFRGEVGHVPHNIVEEIEIEKRPIKATASNSAAYIIVRSSSAPSRGFVNVNGRREPNSENYSQHLRSPSQGNHFIMQSNHSTSTNRNITREQFFQQPFSPSMSSISSPPPPPPPPAPPLPPSSSIPPPPPLPEQLLSTRSSLWSSIQLPSSARRDRTQSNSNPPTPRNDKLQEELTQRLTDRVGTINSNSSSDDVQRWLASKQISSQLARNLQGMTGEELFQVSKATLDQFTDETESARIYSLLSQQKKLAGYKSTDTSNQSSVLNGSPFGSLKARRTSNSDGHSSFRLNNSLTRSLKIKLKQRRDIIEQSEVSDRNLS